MKLSKHDKLLMNLTKRSYEQIVSDFSASRNYIWPDLAVFLKFVKDNNRVLDLGCGNGRLSELFQNKKITYIGLDPVKGLIAEAKKKYPKLTFKIGNILTFKTKKKFDVIVCVAVLNHLPSPALQLIALKNIKRALNPGGYLLMSNWNLNSVKNPKGIKFFNKVKKSLNSKDFLAIYKIKKEDLNEKDVLTKWGNKNVLYYYAFDKDELEKLIKKSGLHLVKNYYSKNGRVSVKSQGANLITIARLF